MQEWAAKYWEECVKHKLYPDAAEEIAHILSLDIKIVLLSGTFKLLARPLMDYLGVKEIICAEPEIKHNCFTGRLLIPHPYGKRKIGFAREWMKDRDCDWQHVWAIADHFEDRFLLQYVRTPIAMHASSSLRMFARRHNWIVCDEWHEFRKVIENDK